MLHIPLEEAWVIPHTLLDILQSSDLSKVALSINEAILGLAKMVWHIRAICAPTLKKTKEKYFIPSKAA